ncbi:hypothetical protein V8G54_007568 [Vigna mungo]|uniref:Uncharacterized protein n=1 Tax=Vigna mungo TaxID=3915 RepID=A0AAQ3P1C8_VIGMU
MPFFLPKIRCKIWSILILIRNCALVEQSLDVKDDLQVRVSLHALQGVTGGNTLQLTGIIKKQELPFFIDTGRTHNFISEKWMKSLGLKTTFIRVFCHSNTG